MKKKDLEDKISSLELEIDFYREGKAMMQEKQDALEDEIKRLKDVLGTIQRQASSALVNEGEFLGYSNGQFITYVYPQTTTSNEILFKIGDYA